MVVGEDGTNGGLWCSPVANTSSPTSSAFSATRTIALMRSCSVGVRPLVGSVVTSPTEKIPNCTVLTISEVFASSTTCSPQRYGTRQLFHLAPAVRHTGRWGREEAAMTLPPNLSTHLDTAALRIAARGWPVFPLRPGSKLPAVRDWEHRATTDPEQIAAWWSRGPYNIGIACGPAGLVVLDLDAAHGHQPPRGWPEEVGHGRDVLRLLAREAGEPDPVDTYTVSTPSGGE